MSSNGIYKILGWICAVLALVFFPIILGPAGVILGYLARSRGDKEQGTIIMIVSISTTIIGMLLGAILGSLAGY